MVNSEFERMMLQRMNETCDNLSKTREELVGLKQLVTDHIDYKVKQTTDAQNKSNSKYNKMMAIIAAVSAISGIGSAWAIVQSIK